MRLYPLAGLTGMQLRALGLIARQVADTPTINHGDGTSTSIMSGFGRGIGRVIGHCVPAKHLPITVPAQEVVALWRLGDLLQDSVPAVFVTVERLKLHGAEYVFAEVYQTAAGEAAEVARELAMAQWGKVP